MYWTTCWRTLCWSRRGDLVTSSSRTLLEFLHRYLLLSLGTSCVGYDHGIGYGRAVMVTISWAGFCRKRRLMQAYSNKASAMQFISRASKVKSSFEPGSLRRVPYRLPPAWTSLPARLANSSDNSYSTKVFPNVRGYSRTNSSDLHQLLGFWDDPRIMSAGR